MREKRVYSKYLPLRRRHHALTVLDRIKSSKILRCAYLAMLYFFKLRIKAQNYSNRAPLIAIARKMFLIWISFYMKYREIRTINSAILWQKLPKIRRKYIKIDDLDDNFIYNHLRFHSKDQLRQLITCSKRIQRPKGLCFYVG